MLSIKCTKTERERIAKNTLLAQFVSAKMVEHALMPDEYTQAGWYEEIYPQIKGFIGDFEKIYANQDTENATVLFNFDFSHTG